MPIEGDLERTITYSQALLEAMDFCMEKDERVHLFGLGVPDPKGIFGTTKGLVDKFGDERVFDMPTAENGMTGVAIGSSLVGLRPVMTHQRVEFALLAIEPIVNQAAKWHYMTGGAMKVPLVIRLISGRGWGQGPQHSQTLDVWFAHIPGLKVVAPATPSDAKNLLIASVEDDNPVIFIEHRWLHETLGNVPLRPQICEIGKASVIKEGCDLTFISHSYALLEVLECAKILNTIGVSAEVVDLRTLRPLDYETILTSVKKTGRVIVVENGWSQYGISAEVVSFLSENAFDSLKSAPKRLGTLSVPIPSTRKLANLVYPNIINIIDLVRNMLPFQGLNNLEHYQTKDIPNENFMGPF